MLCVVCTLPGAAWSGDAADGRAPVMVKTAAARSMRFVETITADGSIASKYYALVSPRITGPLDAVMVREGHRVMAGETALFEVDNLKLRQALEMSEQELALAKSTLEERDAALESVTTDVEQAQRDYARHRHLYEGKVMTLSDFEQSKSKLDQLLAQQKVNRMQVVLARQTVERQAIAVRMAAKDLDDSVALAPIDGVVSQRLSEPGEMGMPGTPVIRIDDVDNLKAVAYLPGQYYPRVKEGAAKVLLSANGVDAGEFTVTYKSPSIDAAYRTFEIWADVPGDREYVVPGAQCVVRVILAERTGIGVPKDAIQQRGAKRWIFLPEDGLAAMVEVTPGLEQDGYVELIDSPVREAQRVVVQGQFLLDAGTPIHE